MKKILFASTALVATAGMAAAEINFSGLGRFGLRYIENNASSAAVQTATNPADNSTVRFLNQGGAVRDDTFLESRFRLNIDGNAETDGGVAFSARVRLQADDNADGSAGTAGLNGARFTTQYEGFRVDVGNIAGVIDNLPGYYGFEPGLTAFTGQYVGADFAFDAYTSTGAGENGIFAQYAFGNFAVSASYSGDDAGSDYTIFAPTITLGDGADHVITTGDSEQYGISFAYNADTWNVALGYAETSGLQATTWTAAAGTGILSSTGTTNADAEMIVLSAGATFGAFTGNILIGDESSDADPTGVFFDTFYGVSGSYEVGAATTIGFSYGDGSADQDLQSFGLGVVHDLGGGVSLRGGIGSNKVGNGSSSTVGDLGVQFNF